ncbi:aromatic amino acid aminotransferase 1 [Stemphylium lycopersici]|uniref:Aromatic amino acid aminotransferase 1 n=1 Tax=Stemphylium lycopersici TaxID=183478 RepID=A0A364MRP7_STELY|nr:aromatic amino acid aminotransferase 1 [Stemphylium lycopersici]RAQ98554.1 aromatic amino acid aminotransferase 1 [Stemphylium lycopersici]RAQ99677.1 aromatic amino acid aminotransferase 1 [Stemphylium lycopersici]
MTKRLTRNPHVRPESFFEMDTSATNSKLSSALPKTDEITATRPGPRERQRITEAPSGSIDSQIRSREGKPKAKRWDHIISQEARIRKGHSLMKAAKFLRNPGIISLGTGLPSSEYFPFERLSIKVPVTGYFSESQTREFGVTITAGKYDLAHNKSLFDISTSFNYGQGSGSAQLLRWVTEHTDLVHHPPYQDWRCAMSVGSTSALEMAFRMLSQPGDMVLFEEYTFSAAVEIATPLGIRPVSIPIDSEGLLPEAVDDILSDWDVYTYGTRKPHLLYTIPTGQNPTGATQSTARRRSLYSVCQKHDILVIEDDPYYFLQMEPFYAHSGSATPASSSHAEFLQSLVPSLLSMDTDGRVMRLDSFSKVISPGSRIGWVTASQQIIERFKAHAGLSTQGPSGISQLLLWKLLEEHWGHPGYLDWLVYLRMEYNSRREIILSACERFLPQQVVSWSPPMAETVEEQIFMRVIDHGVLIMCGSWFRADSTQQLDTLFFRATYAAAPAEHLVEGIRRLGEAIREEFELK